MSDPSQLSVSATPSYVRDKVAVVTGAGSGFGKLTSAMLADRGATVVGFDVTASDGCHVVDVTDLAAMRAAVDRVVGEHGRIDIMVNNAGIMPLAFLADHGVAADAWNRCIDVNLKGVLHGIYAVYDHMIRQGGGHIVNISSIYGNRGVAGAAVYSATKAAVVAVSDALRVEAQGKIKVTVVRPTGVPGTNLGSAIIDLAAIMPMAGHNAERMAGRFAGDGMGPETLDADDVRYWAISPEELAAQIVYVIDQPAGIAISDITVRATGEDYVY
jgi:NADP-dependent 3-hydroxy acid dehydrogenase YdfG